MKWVDMKSAQSARRCWRQTTRRRKRAACLVGGIATGKKAREVFELTSEFFEACPDGNPAGWDEDDWRAFIATGDRIMGAGLPLVWRPGREQRCVGDG